MRKLLNKPWFVAVLALAAVLLVGRMVSGQLHGPGRATRPAAGPPPGDSGEVEEALPGGDAAPAAPASVTEALASLTVTERPASPFVEPVQAPVAAPVVVEEELPVETQSIHLSAVWRQPGAVLALLNGRVQAVGDVIGRMRVDAIDLDGVWLSHGQGRDFVPLGSDFTLATPARSDPVANPASHEG